jgi:hypothetical protein
MRRKRGGPLGEVEQRRVGGLRLDWAIIDGLAKKLVGKFAPCPRAPSLVQPAPHTVAFQARGPRDPERGTVAVNVVPGQDLGPATAIEGAAHKHWRGRDVWTDIEINARQALCEEPKDWRERIRNMLAHEMTHALDPRKPTPKMLQRLRAEKQKGAQHQRTTGFCEYVNREREIPAFINQAREELRRYPASALHRLGDWPLDKMLKLSKTWQEIEECLAPRTRQRFYQMAARTLTRNARGGWKIA